MPLEASRGFKFKSELGFLMEEFSWFKSLQKVLFVINYRTVEESYYLTLTLLIIITIFCYLGGWKPVQRLEHRSLSGPGPHAQRSPL